MLRHAAYNTSVFPHRNHDVSGVLILKMLSRAAFIVGASLIPLTLMAPVHAQTKPAAAKSAKAPIAVIETVKGTIKVRLYPEVTPKTVENFIKLAKKGFYNGLTFHRVEPGFVVQGGDPKGNGSGGPGYEIKNEDNKMLKHNRGAVAMANAGPDTAGSQFYFVINKPAPHLDEKDERGISKYTIFGQIISGQDVAEKIAVGDKMTKVTIIEPKK
jgi:peptidyl-prolyl cis-trans isomerase B (cyclophilin B)